MPARLKPEWVARLHEVDPQAELRFNSEVGRWEFRLTSGDGVLRSQFWGWFVNPINGVLIPPDPMTGLPPFRDLDDAAIEEACQNLERTFVGNPYDGAGSTKREMHRRQAFNDRKRKSMYRDAGELWADMFLDRLPRMRGDASASVLIDLKPKPKPAGPLLGADGKPLKGAKAA